ncbi:MAG TPA: globin [Caulobacteraceae bacterium]|jgi:hemoglobin-like flavoprotein|nr:globin [Caulobacteraceae bacterium]
MSDVATTPNLIEATLELAAERCEDLTPQVYRRLFAEHPQMEALFVRDANNLVKGEMLARVIEAILDFAGERRYAATLIQCEVVTHAGYEVPPEVFGVFFATVAAELRLVLGADWTPAIDRAWRELLEQLDYYVTHPDQALTQKTSSPAGA